MKLRLQPLFSDTINKFIRDHLKHDCFIGTFPSDLLPYTDKRPISLIGNTHTSNEPGEHWVAIILFKDGRGEYFDSYGLPPINKHYREYMEKNCFNGWEYNSKCIQNPSYTSMSCGHYCIVYLILRCTGQQHCQILCKFNDNLESNDNNVVKLTEKLDKFCRKKKINL